MFPQALGFDDHAHVLALRGSGNGAHWRPEVADVEAAAQHLGQGGFREIDNDVLTLLPHVHADLVAWQIDDDPAFAGGAPT